MKKKTRRLLFYGSVLLFVFISCVTVLFALGYKYDFVENKLLKTGSFELRLNLPVEVYVNNELAGSTSFLSNSFSKSRLLPRSYTVRTEKDGYQPWQKSIKIDAGLLTSFPRIVLVPQNFAEKVVASSSLSNISVRQFDPERELAIIGNKKQLEAINLKTAKEEPFKQSELKSVLQTKVQGSQYVLSPDGSKNAQFDDHEIRINWLKDSDYQPFKKLGDTDIVTRFSEKIADVQWYKDSGHLVISVGGILKFVETDVRGGINIFEVSTIVGPFYYDHDQDAIFKFDGNRLIRLNFSK